MNSQEKKNWIERSVSDGEILSVYPDLKEFLRKSRTVPDFHFGWKILRKCDADLRAHVFRGQVRLALLTSYTNDFLTPLLQTDMMLEDLGCEIYTGRYNQVRQDILDQDGDLYKFRPDLTIIALEIEDIFQDRVAKFAQLTGTERSDFKREVLDMYDILAQRFHEHTDVSRRFRLFLQNQSHPFQAYDPLAVSEDSLSAFIREVNAGIEQLCRKFPNTYLLDYARLMEQHGIQQWRDPRLYYTAHIPVARQNWLHVSDAYVSYIKAALNLNIKCIVLDLDNTIWGGILGEEGIDNIQIGNTYPGSAFRKFQQYLLSLHSNGYILALASKNNWEDVREVLNRHPSMVLREEHFAGIQVNWREKAANIMELSREIGISLDHMLFVDDNPIEICKVKSALPALTCLALETPPLNFPAQFASLRCLGQSVITDEDKRRGEWYFRDRQRRNLKHEAPSIQDFYRDLRQRLVVHANSKKHLARIVQLTERTNQFNMTTMRLTENHAKELLDRPDYLLITAELTDRFGNNGLIAYAQIRMTEKTWHLENLLMSCRVLGRMAEGSLLDYVIEAAKQQGANSIEATVVLTKKNAPFADFYEKRGFTLQEGSSNKNGTGKTYVLDVASYIPMNSVMEVVKNNG